MSAKQIKTLIWVPAADHGDTETNSTAVQTDTVKVCTTELQTDTAEVSIWVDDIVGNCRGRKSNDTDLHTAMQPLRKQIRKRHSSH